MAGHWAWAALWASRRRRYELRMPSSGECGAAAAAAAAYLDAATAELFHGGRTDVAVVEVVAATVAAAVAVAATVAVVVAAAVF